MNVIAQTKRGHIEYRVMGQGPMCPSLSVRLPERSLPADVPLLGDEVIAERWEELPEVLTSLLFDGLQREHV